MTPPVMIFRAPLASSKAASPVGLNSGYRSRPIWALVIFAPNGALSFVGSSPAVMANRSGPNSTVSFNRFSSGRLGVIHPEPDSPRWAQS